MNAWFDNDVYTDTNSNRAMGKKSHRQKDKLDWRMQSR